MVTSAGKLFFNVQNSTLLESIANWSTYEIGKKIVGHVTVIRISALFSNCAVCPKHRARVFWFGRNELFNLIGVKTLKSRAIYFCITLDWKWPTARELKNAKQCKVNRDKVKSWLLSNSKLRSFRKIFILSPSWLRGHSVLLTIGEYGKRWIMPRQNSSKVKVTCNFAHECILFIEQNEKKQILTIGCESMKIVSFDRNNQN